VLAPRPCLNAHASPAAQRASLALLDAHHARRPPPPPRLQIARDYGIAPERAPRGAGGARSKAAPPVLLSREDAWAKATARAAATALPLRLLSGVTVESLGRVTLDPGYITESSLATPGFRSHWTDDNGVTFTSAVLRGASGPLYRVWARRGAAAPPAEGEEEGKDGGDDEEEEDALRGAGLEMGSGSSPDQAWAGVGERQQEVQEIAVMQGGAAGLDPAEALLAAAGPLAGRWGTELYGLSELPALQAAEGLAGVEGSVYRFVEERSSWDEEGRRLAREAARVGKDGAGRGPPSGRKPRADRRPTSQAERDAVTVAKLLDGMIRQLEGGEARSAAAELRARQKQERDMQRLQEKEERRLAKDRCAAAGRGLGPALALRWRPRALLAAGARPIYIDQAAEPSYSSSSPSSCPAAGSARRLARPTRRRRRRSARRPWSGGAPPRRPRRPSRTPSCRAGRRPPPRPAPWAPAACPPPPSPRWRRPGSWRAALRPPSASTPPSCPPWPRWRRA
jgi:hypothetical protein